MTDATQRPASDRLPYQIRCPRLPLAVYREVAAHLRQCVGVDAGLLPQPAQKFNYDSSQVGGVWIEYTADAGSQAQQRVEQILTYYGDRYGAWETIAPRETEADAAK